MKMKIVSCVGRDCEAREDCVRYRAYKILLPCEYTINPLNDEGVNCNNFVPVTKRNWTEDNEEKYRKFDSN